MFRSIGLSILIIVSAVILMGCSNGLSRDVVSKEKEVDSLIVSLKVGEAALIKPVGVKIGLRRIINDSRCPIGVECFWEGLARVEAWLLRTDPDTAFVSPAILGGGFDPKLVDLLSGTALGFRIDLLQLDPYPVGEDPIEQEEYEALLRVEIIEPDTAGEVIIANLPPDSIQLDPFTLDSLWIFGDILMLAVHFGGGCEDHKFCLVMSPASFMESFPVQANLYVRHDDHDDPCDAFIGENVSFDLTPIGDLYRLYYGSSGTVLLNVYEYFDNQPSAKQSVEYIFE